MKVIHIPRVSSKKQAEEGDSIDTQINRLNQHSKENNDEVVGVYTDAGKSASISDDKMNIKFSQGKFIIGIDLNKRPAMKRAIEEAPLKKFEGIKFTKWDRFSRNNILSKILQIYFESHGIKLIPTDDSTDPLMVEIKGVLSEEEIRKMKGRVRDVRQTRFDKGMMVGRSPYGYKPIVKDKKIMGFEPKRKEAEIVKEVFKLKSERISYKEICSKLNLKDQSCRNIIKNKVYFGVISFEGNNKIGNQQPIINEDLWNKANGINK